MFSLMFGYRVNRMKWIACVVAVVFIAIAPAFLSGQEVRRAMVEEIQAVPSGASKSWTIGGRVFENLPTTEVVGSNLPAAGDLAIVQFIARDDQLVATAIQSLGVKVAELNDGPYVLWKDATTAEVLTMTGGQVRRKTYQDITGPKVLDGFPQPVKSIVLQ